MRQHRSGIPPPPLGLEIYIQKFQGFASLWLAFREPPRASTPNLRYLRKVYLADIRAIRQPRLPSRKPACRKNLRSSIHGGADSLAGSEPPPAAGQTFLRPRG